ncbi:MAG: hypothetical protein KGV44_09820 [Flavobacteriaceae bacterium]|nr:hypothetical protein [Flavobacteriaceae bacterium]
MKTLNKTATKIFLQLVEKAKANNDYIKIDNTKGVFMPLSVEKIDEIDDYECFSLAHYGQQNGDLMADPEMCFLLAQNETDSIVIPYSFRNDYMGVDRMDILIENNKLKGIRHKAVADNVTFANMWLNNIKNQQNL